MGICKSKPKKKDSEVFVYDKSRIYFDEFGNIRYSGPDGDQGDREAELKQFMEAESKGPTNAKA